MVIVYAVPCGESTLKTPARGLCLSAVAGDAAVPPVSSVLSSGPSKLAHAPPSDSRRAISVSSGADTDDGAGPSSSGAQQPLARSGAAPAHDAATLRALLSSMRFIR